MIASQRLGHRKSSSETFEISFWSTLSFLLWTWTWMWRTNKVHTCLLAGRQPATRSAPAHRRRSRRVIYLGAGSVWELFMTLLYNMQMYFAYIVFLVFEITVLTQTNFLALWYKRTKNSSYHFLLFICITYAERIRKKRYCSDFYIYIYISLRVISFFCNDNNNVMIYITLLFWVTDRQSSCETNQLRKPTSTQNSETKKKQDCSFYILKQSKKKPRTQSVGRRPVPKKYTSPLCDALTKQLL